MKTARIVVLAIAISAGGVAAYLASGADPKPLAPEPTAQLQTVDVLVAKSDIGLGQSVTGDDVQWQTWPAATASTSFIRRNERPDATKEIVGSVRRPPFFGGGPRSGSRSWSRRMGRASWPLSCQPACGRFPRKFLPKPEQADLFFRTTGSTSFFRSARKIPTATAHPTLSIQKSS